MPRNPRLALFALALLALFAAGPSHAEEPATVQVTIQDHRFSPDELHVPAGKPVFVEIANTDATAEEFESGVLAIEKVVPGHGRVRLRLRPLAPGRFAFVGEYHEATAKGAIVADPPAAK